MHLKIYRGSDFELTSYKGLGMEILYFLIQLSATLYSNHY